MGQIFSLSEAASIGLHAMVLIARSDAGLNVQAIADKTGSSKHHIAKVLQRLTKDNLLSSVRGPSGGFTLKKDPKAVTLLDVYESIEGRIEINDCPLNHEVCAFENCLMSNLSQAVTLQAKEYLRSRTLDSYLGQDAAIIC